MSFSGHRQNGCLDDVNLFCALARAMYVPHRGKDGLLVFDGQVETH